MRVIVARSNSFIPSKCKKQPPCQLDKALLPFLTSFYGNSGTKFPDKIQAVGKLAGSYEYTNTSGVRKMFSTGVLFTPRK